MQFDLTRRLFQSGNTANHGADGDGTRSNSRTGRKAAGSRLRSRQQLQPKQWPKPKTKPNSKPIRLLPKCRPAMVSRSILNSATIILISICLDVEIADAADVLLGKLDVVVAQRRIRSEVEVQRGRCMRREGQLFPEDLFVIGTADGERNRLLPGSTSVSFCSWRTMPLMWTVSPGR